MASSLTSSNGIAFDKRPSLKYLGLPEDYSPSPDVDPMLFLSLHLSNLPPHILAHYSYITTPKQRTSLIPIRNRRLRFANARPPELSFASARNTWPELWQGRERRGVEEGIEEREWAQNSFLEGNRQLIGRIGNLLADYEEEREAERVRDLRRSRMAAAASNAEEDDFIPEEDSDSDEEAPPNLPAQESDEEARSWFERRVRERFIYGLLDRVDYDKVDWDEGLGVDDEREAEERWFEEDDELE